MNQTGLLQLLAIPTAPYREERVSQWIQTELRKHQVPYFCDTFGNLVVGVSSEQEYRILLSQPEKEPLRMFVAHMDHPGFHGTRWKSSSQLEVKWLGGTPRKHLVGSAVWLALPDGTTTSGTLVSATLDRNKTHLVKAMIRCDLIPEKVDAKQLFGGFAFKAPVWKKGSLIYTKAADDLVGCFVAIELLKKVIEDRPRRAIALLTRAEEVGFVGCIAHVTSSGIQEAKRPLVFVSLETSRTLPGAEIGKGPVVRLGDRASIFSAAGSEVLHQVAEKKLKKKYQRRIMDGGTCEATVGVAHRIPSIGISIPLGNYHNQGLQGGPECRGELGPAPEFVSISDIQGMLKLCEGLLEVNLPWEDPWENRRQQLGKYLKEGKPLLERFS
ncbi:hypothetical protein EBQ90_05850 [bacterium]|nr:hypothetical protein [bacterium]